MSCTDCNEWEKQASESRGEMLEMRQRMQLAREALELDEAREVTDLQSEVERQAIAELQKPMRCGCCNEPAAIVWALCKAHLGQGTLQGNELATLTEVIGKLGADLEAADTVIASLSNRVRGLTDSLAEARRSIARHRCPGPELAEKYQETNYALQSALQTVRVLDAQMGGLKEALVKALA